MFVTSPPGYVAPGRTRKREGEKKEGGGNVELALRGRS